MWTPGLYGQQVDVTADLSIDTGDPLKVRVVYRPAAAGRSMLRCVLGGCGRRAGNAAATDAWTKRSQRQRAPILDQFLRRTRSNVGIDTDISSVRDSLSASTSPPGRDRKRRGCERRTGHQCDHSGRRRLRADRDVFATRPLNYGTAYNVHVEAADVVGNQAAADWSSDRARTLGDYRRGHGRQR